jgi:aminoglycoside 3-N-acetyltransferase
MLIKCLDKLLGLKIPRDATLLVHSSFKGLARSGFSAEDIVEHLLSQVPDGTLLMPTMTWRTVTPESPIFHQKFTPSHTGYLTEFFRTTYATSRSLHPTHSVCGTGVNAKKILSSHHIGTTPVSKNSPYGLMQEFQSYILMLGVGLDVCTAIHHSEELIAPELYLEENFDKVSYTLINEDGGENLFNLRRHRRLPRNFNYYYKFKNEFSALQGTIQGLDWLLVNHKELDALVRRELIKNKKVHLRF